MEPPSCEGPPLPGEEPSCALRQALSRILHRLTGQDTRRADASNAALQELGALMEGAEGEALFGGGDTPTGGMPEMLGQVARALEKAARPPKEREGGGERPGPPDVAETAVAVGSIFLQLLGKAEAARSRPPCPSGVSGVAGLRRVTAPAYVFAVTHAAERPWSSPGSRDVARQVLAQLLTVTGSASVTGLLVGEREEDPGRLPAILAFLQPELSK